MDYLNASPEEKEAWIQAYIERHLENGYDIGGKRKRSDNGKIVSVGVQTRLRVKAKNKWRERAKRQTAHPKSTEKTK